MTLNLHKNQMNHKLSQAHLVKPIENKEKGLRSREEKGKAEFKYIIQTPASPVSTANQVEKARNPVLILTKTPGVFFSKKNPEVSTSINSLLKEENLLISMEAFLSVPLIIRGSPSHGFDNLLRNNTVSIVPIIEGMRRHNIISRLTGLRPALFKYCPTLDVWSSCKAPLVIKRNQLAACLYIHYYMQKYYGLTHCKKIMEKWDPFPKTPKSLLQHNAVFLQQLKQRVSLIIHDDRLDWLLNAVNNHYLTFFSQRFNPKSNPSIPLAIAQPPFFLVDYTKPPYFNLQPTSFQNSSSVGSLTYPFWACSRFQVPPENVELFFATL